MFQNVAEFWKVLVREDFYMHQIGAVAPNPIVGASLLAKAVGQ